MPLYFIAFLAMLGASALLYAAALVAAGIRRRPPPVLVNGAAAHSGSGQRLLSTAPNSRNRPLVEDQEMRERSLVQTLVLANCSPSVAPDCASLWTRE